MKAELLSEALALDRENPWPGLDYFDERASELFHGRDTEINELLQRVVASSVTVLFGKSGLGKTSLLRAGLFPRLRAENFLPVYVRFDVGSSASALIGQIQARLFAELKGASAEFPEPEPGESLWEYLHRADLELWSAHNYRLTPVFVFDQFEELFTLGAANPRKVDQLRTELGDLLENRIPSALEDARERGTHGRRLELHAQLYRAVVSLREDFLAELESSTWAGAMPSLLQRENRMPLRPMSIKQGLQAVHDTAPHLIDAELAAVVVRFIAGSPQSRKAGTALRDETATLHSTTFALGTTTTFAAAGSFVEPALLSLLCHELNEVRKVERKTMIDLEIFEAKKETIISDYYRKSIADLPDKVGRFIEQQLITQQGFRNSFPVDDAIQTGLVTEDQIRLLVNRRILRLEERYGTRRVELTHDLLTHSVRENRALRDAEDAERRRQVELEKERRLQKEEVERLDADNRRQRSLRRQWRNFATISLILTVAAGVATVYAFFARNRLQEALSTAASVKAASESVVFTDPTFGVPSDLSALLALAADALSPSMATRRGLLSAYQRLLDARAILPQRTAVACVAFSPDGEKVASAGWGKSVIVWNTATGRTIGELRGHEGAVFSLAFSPDGATVASAGADATVRLWNVADGRAFGDPVGEPLHGHKGRVWSVRFSPDGSTLATAGADATVRLWNVATRQQVAVLSGHTGEVKSLAFSPPDGRTLASGSWDGSVILWDVQARRMLGEPLRSHPVATSAGDRAAQTDDGARVFAVAFSADGKKLASASFDNTVTFWDPQTRRMSDERLRDSLERHLLSMDLAPDGNALVSSTREGTITLRTLQTGSSTAWSIRTLSGGGAAVLSVAFKPNSDAKSRSLASASWDGTAVLWDLVHPVQVTELHPGRIDRLDGAAFSPDGRTLAFPGKENSVALWGVAEPHPVEYLSGHVQRVSSVAFSRDGKFIASGSADGEVILWDAATRRQIGEPMNDHKQRVTALAFSPNGQTLASASDDKTVILWNVATQRARDRPIQPSDAGAITDLAYSRDGRMLVIGTSDGKLAPWDPVRGTPLPIAAPTSKSEGVTAFALTPDGASVISIGSEGSLIMRDMSSWATTVEHLEESRTRMLKLMVFPDGNLLASVGSGSTIILRDAKTLQSLGALVTRQQAEFSGVALSPDGRTIATIGKDESVILWDADLATLRSNLCKKLQRSLSHKEWSKYIGAEAEIPYKPQCEQLPAPTS
jgi:WD40 repeat protein